MMHNGRRKTLERADLFRRRGAMQLYLELRPRYFLQFDYDELNQSIASRARIHSQSCGLRSVTDTRLRECSANLVSNGCTRRGYDRIRMAYAAAAQVNATVDLEVW